MVLRQRQLLIDYASSQTNAARRMQRNGIGIQRSAFKIKANVLAKLPLPLYSYLELGGSGAVLLRFNQHLFVPLFTSFENALLYASRSDIAVDAILLSTADEILRFVSTVPVSMSPDDELVRIAVDPIAPDVSEILVVEKSDLLEYCRNINTPEP